MAHTHTRAHTRADLRDLLTTQRRAHQRVARLEPRGGNTYAFLVAPSYIKNA